MAAINKGRIVGVDFSENGDTGVLIVVEQKNGKNLVLLSKLSKGQMR